MNVTICRLSIKGTASKKEGGSDWYQLIVIWLEHYQSIQTKFDPLSFSLYGTFIERECSGCLFAHPVQSETNNIWIFLLIFSLNFQI